MPDEPARPVRPPAPRLPGTYAANYGDDPNWRRGVAMLWTFFLLAAVEEAVLAAFILLRGNLYPAPLDAVRLCLGGALFVALWLGWGWLRWPWAVMNFLYGAWLIVWMISTHADEAAAQAAAGAPAPGYGIGSVPQISLGIVYLAYACYLAFSADVLDFLRHRREAGRGWVAVPVVLLVGIYLAGLLSAQFTYLGWLNLEKASAARFATQSLEAISNDHWAASAYESRADPEYLKTWFDGDRNGVFEKLSHLGAYRHADAPTAVMGSAMDADKSGFVLRGVVTVGKVDFAHGGTTFTFDVTRTLFGSWKLQGFDAGNPRFDGATP